MPEDQSSPPDSFATQLAELADFFDSKQEDIMRSWREAVEVDVRLTTAIRLNKVEFEDNVTALLNLLGEQLRNDAGFGEDLSGTTGPNTALVDIEEHRHSNEHGFHRWQEGYNLRELVLEIGHFHLCLLKVLGEFEVTHPETSTQVFIRAHRTVGELVNTSYAQSVTEYNRLQQTEASEIVRNLTEALREIDREERRRGQTLREAVHDLQGNLTAVQSVASLFGKSETGVDTGVQTAAFGLLQRSTSTLQEMLSELLDLARLEAGQENLQIADFDAANLLRGLCEAAKPLAESQQLCLEWEGPQNLVVNGDALKVQRIAQNLLLNSLKYTREGNVTARWRELDAKQWEFSIQDTGPGLLATAAPSLSLIDNKSPLIEQLSKGSSDEPDKIDQILDVEMAEEAKLAAKGEGVGLAIVKRLTMLLDGKVEVETTIGVGTTFRVTLPRAYPNSPANAPTDRA